MADRDTRTEAAAKAIVMVETAGCCDEWPRPCRECDCFRAARPVESAARDRQRAREALAAADADDRENGIVRIKLDDELPRRILAALAAADGQNLDGYDLAHTGVVQYGDQLRAVLAVLREAVQP